MSQGRGTTRKGVRRSSAGVGKRVLVASVFLLLLAASRLVGSQSNSSAAPATPHPASPAVAAAKADNLPLDGLKLTDDQKTRIAQVRQDIEARTAGIIKNESLSPDRKETILLRLHRMETSEIFRVLTPDQQKELQKRIMDQHAAEQKEHQSKQATPASQ